MRFHLLRKCLDSRLRGNDGFLVETGGRLPRHRVARSNDDFLMTCLAKHQLQHSMLLLPW